MKRILSLMALLALFITNQAHAVVVQIDTLQTPLSMAPLLGSDPIGSQSFGRAIGAGIIGGEREVTITKTSDATGRSTDKIEGSIEDGIASISAGLRTSWTATFLWDGSADNGITGVGVNDLGLNTPLPYFNTFVFDATVDIPASVVVTFQAYTTLVDYSETSISYLLGGGINGNYAIPLELMTPIGAGVDWNNVMALRLSFDATVVGTDVEFYIEDARFEGPPPELPEVSTAVSAAGFAAIGSIFLLRNRKKNMECSIEESIE